MEGHLDVERVEEVLTKRSFVSELLSFRKFKEHQDFLKEEGKTGWWMIQMGTSGQIELSVFSIAVKMNVIFMKNRIKKKYSI